MDEECDDSIELIEALKQGIRLERRFHFETDLLQESLRLVTFLYFEKKDTVDIQKLANRGYYYNRRDDTVVCYNCKSIVNEDNNWEDKEHDDSEECDMSIYPLCGNVPLLDESLHVLGNFYSLVELLNELKTCQLCHNIPDPNNHLFFNKEHIKVSERSNFENYDERLATFNWFINLPEDKKPDKKLWAKAGFVYTGYSDFVMCFMCKGGLINILKEDDPIDDHMEFYGHCKFIKEYCSKNNIEHTDNTKKISMFLMERDEFLLMTHPMVKNLTFHGYDANLIRRYICNFVKKFGYFPYNLQYFRKEIERLTGEYNKLKNK